MTRCGGRRCEAPEPRWARRPWRGPCRRDGYGYPVRDRPALALLGMTGVPLWLPLLSVITLGTLAP